MDITEHTFNEKTKIIKDIYLNKNKNDHHLDNENSYSLWLNELNKIII